MKTGSLLLISALFLCSTGPARAADPSPGDIPALPVPELETLSNGLQLVWFVSDKLPIVDLALLVKSGSRNDPPGKSGTAQLLSECLDRGAAGMSAQQIARAVEMLGANRYVSAEEETLSLGMHGLAVDAPVLLELLSKIALHPDFPEAEVSREHALILDRWSHLPDYGDTLVTLAYRRFLSSGTPYGRGPFLSAREFSKVTREDVIQFHREHFTPANSVFMVVGRVNKSEFRALIEKQFGGKQFGEPEAAAKLKSPKTFSDPRLPNLKRQIVIVNRPDLSQAQVRIGFRAPLYQSPDHYSLTVANALLGEYFNSRLNTLIRDRLGLTYGIGSAFSYNRDLAVFTVSSTTRNESVGQLIRKVLDVLKTFKQGPITEDEVRTAKEYLEGGFPLSTSTLGAVASRWLSGYVFGLGPAYLNDFVPKIHAVTRRDVENAVAQHFDLDHLVITVAGDAKQIRKSIEDVKLPAVKVLQPKDLM